LKEPREMISEPVAFGSVQVPPEGQPIVLTADRQTIGGYPRIAEVVSVDLPLLAQLRPGDRLLFTSVSVEEAQALLLAEERALSRLHEGLSEKYT
jgi:antagonist of KipI